MESHTQRSNLVSLPLNQAGLGLYWFASSSRKKEIEDQAVILGDLIAIHRESTAAHWQRDIDPIFASQKMLDRQFCSDLAQLGKEQITRW